MLRTGFFERDGFSQRHPNTWGEKSLCAEGPPTSRVPTSMRGRHRYSELCDIPDDEIPRP